MPPDDRRALVRVAAAAIVLVLAGQLWLVFHRALNVDEFEHVHATWCVSRGLMPYRDFFEHHTPWLYFLFAPLFRQFAADVDPDAAYRLLIACRLAMWLFTAVAVALVFELGRLWRDATTGVLAAFLTASSIQFLDTTLEFRPDVPALACWLVSLVCALRGWQSVRLSRAVAWFAAGGFAFGSALLFTQKYIFAIPGVALMLLGYVIDRRGVVTIRKPVRLGIVAVFVAGICAPVAVTAGWFISRGAAAEFVYYNLGFNVRQNALRFSPMPLLVSNLVHSPALVVLGSIGLWTGLSRSRIRDRDAGLVLFSTAASLVAGLVVFGRVYGQYIVMFFPHLAVFAAAAAPELAGKAGSWLPARSWFSRALIAIPPAACVALVLGIDNPRSATGLVMLVSFTASAVLTAVALGWRANGHGARSALLAILALTTMTAGNAARIFRPIAPQLSNLTYVTTHTNRDDLVLGSGVAGGAGAFRPNAWYYFFHPDLATEHELAEMVAGVTSGRLRPRIIAFDPSEGGAPPGLHDYMTSHYRLIQGSIYERLPE